MISPQSIEQLLNIAVIEDVVGDYVNLKRAGSRFKGVCPFHDEKTPSFVVTPSLGIYKCFGCQKGGNSLNFLMEVENLSYVEAAKSLAARYGLELIETGKGDDNQYKEAQKQRESIQVVLDYASAFFQQQLTETEEGKTIGYSYFKERGFLADTIRKWQLGYSPEDWNGLSNDARTKGYTLPNLELAGLVRKKENGDYFDLFRNRVIFPIHSVSGKVIAFAGRKMNNADKAPKYVNSPETELYKKSEILYGIFQAKNAIKKFDKVYLTEGYTDVITLSQFGIENVVASSGTALTPGQIKLLRRFTSNITVIYDGDAAGVKASLRGIDLLLAEDLNVRVVSLPEGDDPDSFCKLLGGEGFQNYIKEHEENFIFFKARLLLQDVQGDPLKKSDAVRNILESVAQISDALKRTALVRELSRICYMEESVLSSELAKLLRGKSADKNRDFLTEIREVTQAAGIELPKEVLGDEHIEKALLKAVMLHGEKMFDEELTTYEFIKQEIDASEKFEYTDSLSARILPACFEENPDYPGISYFVHHPDPEMASWAAGVLSSRHELSKAFAENEIYIITDEDNYRSEVVHIFLYMRHKKLDNLIKFETEKLKDANEDAEEILMKIKYFKDLQANIATQLGGISYSV